MKTNILKIGNLSCPTCVRRIENALSKTKGVNKTEVLFNSGKVIVTFDESIIDIQTISKTIQNIGYEVVKVM